eukprot:scaffold90434_cov16-Tisochrysis_lutea.AAC.1
MPRSDTALTKKRKRKNHASHHAAHRPHKPPSIVEEADNLGKSNGNLRDKWEAGLNSTGQKQM